MPSIWDAILFFMKTGCFSIGGGYAAINMIQVQLVDIWQIMTQEEFGSLLVIAEATPGPLTINAATFVGFQLAGVWGGALCTLGYIFPTILICVGLSYIYRRFHGESTVNQLLSYLRPAVIALIAATAVNLICSLLFGSSVKQLHPEALQPVAFVLLAAAFWLIHKKKLPPVAVILGCGAVGCILSLAFGI